MSEVLPSVCPLDCPDRCSLSVTVQDGRVTSLDGSQANPLTDGVICGKVRKFDRRLYGPERLLTPMIRRGAKGPGAVFEAVSWDVALDLVAEKFRTVLAESGGDAVLPYWYAGSNGYLTGGGLDTRLWAKLGTARILRTLCAANAAAAVTSLYGTFPSSDPLDVKHANGMLLWGCNPNASGIHLVPLARELLDRGGELIVVDPRRTPLSKRAALHLAPLPGTDVVIALSMLHLAFRRGYADRTFLGKWTADHEALERHVAEWTPDRAAAIASVRAADIEALAERYAARSPYLLRCGWGVERSRNGTDAIRAILSLPAVFGKFGVRGGGYCLSTSGGYRADSARYQPAHPKSRVVNMSQLGRVLEETENPPIRLLYVYDCNPVATVPDQMRVTRGMARDDLFTVVHEQSYTDSCDYADVLLPATTFLEHRELSRSYGGYLLQWAEPVIAPVGEARPNHWVFQEIARRLGLDDPSLYVSEEELAKQVVEAVPQLSAGAWETLLREKVLVVESPVQFAAVEPERKITFVAPEGPRYREPPADASRALIVISPASTRAISSTLFETLGDGQGRVGLHPDDATRAGVRNGDVVRLVSSAGEAKLIVEVDSDLRPGVASVPKGMWRKSSRNGFTANALVGDHVDEIGGGACYNDARADVLPA